MSRKLLVVGQPGIVRIVTLLSVLWALMALPAAAASEDEVLIALLDEFLAGASNNDIAAHQRFWSEDLVYTSSAGERHGKADIISSMQQDSASESSEPAMVYGREALLVRVYGDTAVITFRLTGSSQSDAPAVTRYYNTGTFLKRDGEWRAIAWQATKMPDET